MSVLTRKQPITDTSGLRGQVTLAAKQVGPLASKTVPLAQQAAQQAQQAAQQAQQAAQQAVPLARSASTSVRQSADGAVAWAAPKVEAARAWAAPQIEQSAHAITENLAPMLSSALVSAAHKIDVPQKKARRSRKLAAAVLLSAAAGAAAFAVIRLRRRDDGFTAETGSGSTDLGPDASDQTGSGSYGQGAGLEDGLTPDPDMNGHPRIV